METMAISLSTKGTVRLLCQSVWWWIPGSSGPKRAAKSGFPGMTPLSTKCMSAGSQAIPEIKGEVARNFCGFGPKGGKFILGRSE